MVVGWALWGIPVKPAFQEVEIKNHGLRPAQARLV
jgi:hypothetical protein